MAWDVYVWLTLGSSAGLILVAGLLYFLQPRATQNRLASAALFAAALGWIAYAFLRTGITPDTWMALRSSTYPLWSITGATYLMLLGTLDTPLSKPWRTKPGVIFLIAYWGGLGLSAALAPTFWIHNAYDAWTPIQAYWAHQWLVIWVYAATVSLHAWRRARAGPTRRKAGFFALAFVAADSLLFVWLSWAALTFWGLLPAWPDYFYAGPPVAYFTFELFLAYGILFGQVLNIDLKIKWGLSKAPIAGSVLAVFLVVGIGLSEFLIDSLGYALGAVAAGGILLISKPLQRLGQRLAEAAMPNTLETPDYLQRRKEDIYQIQVEELMRDGIVTSKERAALLRLQESLRLDAGTANKIEASFVT